MATTVTPTFSHTDRRDSSGSDDQTSSTQTNRFVRTNTNANPPRPGQHLDDADLLAWKHQYMNIGLRGRNVMSNSADDLTQLVDAEPFEGFRHDYNDMDDEELHFDNGNNYDYEGSIHDRLKKANEEHIHDETPAELRHKQRVSFDAIVKAVDIDQDAQDLDMSNPLTKSTIAPVEEEVLPSSTSPHVDGSPHQYTVPLNDTQPREGPTFLEQVKAMQFHGISLIGERYAPTSSHPTHGSSSRPEDSSSVKPSSNNNSDTPMTSDMTTKPPISPQKSMVVAINGGFEIQNEDDYTAKGQTKSPNDQTNTPVGNGKGSFVRGPPTEAVRVQNPSKPPPPQPLHSSLNRPKSSDSHKRTNPSTNSTSKSWADNTNKSSTRPKSAGNLDSLESFKLKLPSGVDFAALNRRALAERREREKAELRKQKKDEEEQKIKLAKAKDSFEKWVHDKDVERKRLLEEKRLEKEEHDAREAQCEKELAEKREKQYREWLERKDREVMLANEFKKLQADDEEMAHHESNSSIHRATRRENHRAFHRWLRQKYEQSREEQRQIKLEARRLRRRQRRSIKRSRLQQDLLLAKSFGYS